MASGFGAGLGGEMLQEILSRKFREAAAMRELDQRAHADEQSYKIRQQEIQERAADRAERQQMMQAAQAEAAKAKQQAAAVRLSGVLTPGQRVGAQTVDALDAGDAGDLVKDRGQRLDSTNLSGVVNTAGAAPRILGLAKTDNPGMAGTFTGTAQQIQGQQDREDRAAQIAQARQDKIDAQRQAAQDRLDAQKQAQEGRKELAHVVASLRPSTASSQADGAAAQQKETNEVQDALSLIQQIRSDKALPTSTGPLQGRGLGMLQDLEGVTRVRALHDNLVNRMSLAQAGKLKGQGQISNMEREMLQKAATALSLKLGDADYLNELAKVEAQFQRMLTGPRATNASPPAATPAAETPEQRLKRLLGGG